MEKEQYEKIFTYFSENHNLILTNDEIDDIYYVITENNIISKQDKFDMYFWSSFIFIILLIYIFK